MDLRVIQPCVNLTLRVARSSRGLGRRPLTPVARVRLPYGLPCFSFEKPWVRSPPLLPTQLEFSTKRPAGESRTGYHASCSGSDRYGIRHYFPHSLSFPRNGPWSNPVRAVDLCFTWIFVAAPAFWGHGSLERDLSRVVPVTGKGASNGVPLVALFGSVTQMKTGAWLPNNATGGSLGNSRSGNQAGGA